MIIEISKKVKEITGAISGTIAILGLAWAGWLTFSDFVDKKINKNISEKLNNASFLSEVQQKLSTVEERINSLYEVDSGYSSILTFDFKSLQAKTTKVKFHADTSKQTVLLSIYPLGNGLNDDDFTIYIDNKQQQLNLWGQISSLDITDLLSKNGTQSNHMHMLKFIPNTKGYIDSDKEKIIKSLEVFILVKNKKGV